MFIQGCFVFIFLHWVANVYAPCYPRNFDWFSWGWSKKEILKKKIQNGQLKKTACFHSANSKYIFPKISGISPWISRIVWCIGYRCDSTYMVLRLSDVSSKTLKKSLPPNIKPYWTTFFNYYQFVIYRFLKKIILKGNQKCSSKSRLNICCVVRTHYWASAHRKFLSISVRFECGVNSLHGVLCTKPFDILAKIVNKNPV